MQFEQLQFFPTKQSFNPKDFENPTDQFFFGNIALSVFEAFNLFSKDNKYYYDNTSRANMLNNVVSYVIKKNCSSQSFEFVESYLNTRRCFGILDGKYLLMFKKSPLANVKTKQDDRIKFQELDKHVLFLTYEVDKFWTEIKKVEFRYYSSPKNIIYSYDVTNLVDLPTNNIVEPMEGLPLIGIKKNAKIKKAQ